MNGYYGNKMIALIEELSRLPGIGSKSAQRLAFHIIAMPKEKVNNLAKTIMDAKEFVTYCEKCCTITDDALCPICKDERRDQTKIMVVKTHETWQLTSVPKSSKGFIISCTVPSHL